MRRPTNSQTGSAAGLTIPEAEYRALRKLRDECVRMRDARCGEEHPLRDWNRMSPGVRLAVVELDAIYRERADR